MPIPRGPSRRGRLTGGHLIIGIRDPRWTATDLAAAVLREGVRVEPLSVNRVIPGRDDALVVYLSRPDATALVESVQTIGRVMRRTDGSSRSEDVTAG